MLWDFNRGKIRKYYRSWINCWEPRATWSKYFSRILSLSGGVWAAARPVQESFSSWFYKSMHGESVSEISWFIIRLCWPTQQASQEGFKIEQNEFYAIKETASYVNVKCGIHPKCRFSIWFKFQEDNKGK